MIGVDVKGRIVAGWTVGVLDGEDTAVGARLDGVIAVVERVGVVCMDVWQPHTNTTRVRMINTLFFFNSNDPNRQSPQETMLVVDVMGRQRQNFVGTNSFPLAL